MVCPASVEAPRKVEAAIFALNDGRLCLAYTAGERSDYVDYVEGEIPKGLLRSWAGGLVTKVKLGLNRFLCVNIPVCSTRWNPPLCFCPVGGFYRYICVETLMYTAVIPLEKCVLCSPFQMTSVRLGRSRNLLMVVRDIFSTNDLLITLDTGRILLPVDRVPKITSVLVWLSDDYGVSWRKSWGGPQVPNGSLLLSNFYRFGCRQRCVIASKYHALSSLGT